MGKRIIKTMFFLILLGFISDNLVAQQTAKEIYHPTCITPEYKKLNSITPFKWETCRGIVCMFLYQETFPKMNLKFRFRQQKRLSMLNYWGVKEHVKWKQKNEDLLLNIPSKTDKTAAFCFKIN
jgi:hypothetical protein